LKRENDISLPGMVERTIPGKPRPASPEVGAANLPCHEVADGFDFPASHRKIKEEFVPVSCAIAPYVISADSKERSDWA
jgi:hypothetical protein